jgi:hypothetical protein
VTRGKRRWSALCLGILLGGSVGEAVTRRCTTVDEAGRRWFLKVPLDLYRAPAAEVQRQLDRMAADKTITEAHPRLGWTLARNRRVGRLYRTDHRGVRVSVEPKPQRQASRRVVTVGDSFTFCSDVPYEESWSYLLEQSLGEDYEVLNLGVPGYGLDQACLRLELRIEELRPGVVLMGLFPADLRRHANVFRSQLQQTAWPLSKPRFVLQSDASLKLCNVPCLDPQQMAAALEQVYQHPLRHLDLWVEPDWLAWEDPLGSRFAGVLWGLARHERRWQLEKKVARRGADGLDLTQALIARLKAACESGGARALGVLIPSTHEVRELRTDTREGWLWCAEQCELPVVDLTDRFQELAERQGLDALFLEGGQGHCTGRGNQLIAEAVESSFFP